MSTFKKFTSNDIIVTPFTVNKSFSYVGTAPTNNDEGAFRVNGKNVAYPTDGTGTIGTGSTALVYNSIKQLYYTNYLSSSNGEVSEAVTASFNPDGTISGLFNSTNYNNYIQSNGEKRYISTASGANISVLSIPTKQFGEYIKPGSFLANNVKDNGQGNIVNNSDVIIGNIIYEAGLVIFGGNIGGSGGTTNTFQDASWESTITLYETQYKCTIRSNELNYSLNPSLLSSSLRGQNKILESGSAQYEDFVTGSDFSPYVTSIGLYDDEQNLLAVAKLSQPLKTSQTTDTTILINLDR